MNSAWNSSLVRRVSAALVIALAFLALACSQPNPGSIAAHVRQAQREGRTVVEIGTETFCPLEGTLADLVDAYSLMVTSPVRLEAAHSVEENAIYTWSVFRVVETLSRKANADFPGCHLNPPASLSLQAGEVARPTVGGAVVIDGVRVTQKQSDWMPDQPGGQYVAAAVFCPNNVAIFPLFGGDVFEVTAEKNLVAVIRWLTPYDYQREMESLGTIDNLKEYLRTHRRSPA